MRKTLCLFGLVVALAPRPLLAAGAPLAARTIGTAAAFDALAFGNGGVVIQGKSVKFLIDNRDAKSPGVYFVNAQYKGADGKTPDSAKYHYFFAKATLPNFTDDLGDFNRVTYEVQDKRYVAGTIQTYKVGPGDALLYGVQFYPEDVAKEQTILKAVKLLKPVFTIPSAKMAFVATGPQQTTASITGDLTGLGFESKTVDGILGSLNYLPMNQGTAYGFLRIFPKSDDLTPMDIAVFDELPLDLAVVAGVITKAVQDASSHVNLKSKERGTPNMVLRDAGPQNTQLVGFKDKPVKLTIHADGYTIAASTAAEVKKQYEKRVNKPWTPLSFEKETKVFSYGEMCTTSPADCLKAAKRFGSKAANLGFLAHKQVLGHASDAGTLSKQLGYDLVPKGAGVPIQFYKDFVAHPPNKELRDKIAALVTAEKGGTLSPAQRAEQSKAVRELFYKAHFPPKLLETIRQKVTAVLPNINKIKVRSSANAEDLPNFDGAGLYDSFGAHMDKEDKPEGTCELKADEEGGGVETKMEMKPKSLACAVKGVYAAVWNKRALEERSFARLDHATSGMGLAIVPKYDLDSPIAGNTVVVTRVIGNEGLYGYSFSDQKGNNLVTNPTPGTYSESVIAAFSNSTTPATFIVTRYATPTPKGAQLKTTVFTNAQMQMLLKIARTAEAAYCKAKPGYYNGSCANVTLDPAKKTSVDMELKFLENGHWVCKQMREFAGH